MKPDPTTSGAFAKSLGAAMVEANQIGMKVHLGPGMEKLMQGFEGFAELQKSSQKDIANMKDLMSKSVEELAAAQPGTAPMNTISVRGRNLVIPMGHAQSITTIQVACLYAMDNPDVDDILRQTGLAARFMMEDGSIVNQPFVSGAPEWKSEGKSEEKPKEPQEKKQEYKPGRSILVDADPEDDVKVPEVNDPVAIVEPDGTPMSLGTVVSVDKKQASCEVKDMHGETAVYPWARLFPIKDTAEAAQWAMKVTAAKVEKLKSNKG